MRRVTHRQLGAICLISSLRTEAGENSIWRISEFFHQLDLVIRLKLLYFLRCRNERHHRQISDADHDVIITKLLDSVLILLSVHSCGNADTFTHDVSSARLLMHWFGEQMGFATQVLQK
jgi:hypothetical protein